MRNLNKFFCLLLTLALLLTSTVALAETVGTEAELTMQTIALSDVQLSMNDVSILDLSGLAVSMGGALDPNTGKGAAQLSILGGDDAAASVNAAWDSSKAVLNVDGLSKPLTLDVEALMAQMFSEENLQAMLAEMMGALTEEEAAAMQEMLEALSELVSEENLNATMEGFDTYMSAVQEIAMGCMSEPTVETHTFAQIGEAEAEHITLTITNKEMAEVMKAAFAFYDSNPAFLKLINAALKLDGEDEQITSFVELSEQVELNDISMNADIYITEDGSDMEMVMNVLEDGEKTGTFELTAHENDDDLLMSMSVDVDVEESGDPVSVNFAISVTASEQFEGEQEINVTLDVSDEDGPASISLWYGPDETFGHMGTLNIVGDDETVGMAIANSDTQKIFTIYDDTSSIEMGYVSENQGAEAGEGTVYCHVDDGSDKYALSATVHTTISTISEAEIDEMLAVEGIDVMTIGEDDISTLTNEVIMVAMEAVGVLGQNVPGLSQLMGNAMTVTNE